MKTLCAALCLSLLPALAGAHGGLPLTTQIVWRKDTMYLPTQYWGVFVGTEAGPWHWICDEAINGFLLREVYLGGDDTFYATNTTGLTISRDGGCDWQAVQGPLGEASVSDVLPDPVRPARAWATSVMDGKPVLWRSDDSGRTWQQVFTAQAQAQRGLVISPDGARIYLTALRVDLGPVPVPTLYVSTDGGDHFDGRQLTPTPPFLRTVPLAVDPRDPKVVYLANQADTTEQALLRASGDTGQVKELVRTQSAIFSVTIDVTRGRLLAATGDGLYYGDSPDGAGALTRSGGLSRAQCASVQGGHLYSCSWNYYPDMAAVARSDDGGLAFRKVFQYADTQGVLACPANTTVGRTCPGVWDTYASLLGIDTGQAADMGGGPGPQPGCSCALSPGGAKSSTGPVLLLLLLALGAPLRRWLGRRGRLT